MRPQSFLFCASLRHKRWPVVRNAFLPWCVLLATSAVAAAQTGSVQDRPPEDARPGPNLLPGLPESASAESPLSWEAGLVAVPRYVSRGLIYSVGPSAQPYASVDVALPEMASAGISEPHVTLGGWASMQAVEPGLDQRNSGPMKGWYEQDVFASIGATVLRDLSVVANYYYYLSPSRSFDAYSEVQIALRYDDRRLWKKSILREFTLSPSLLVAREVGRPQRRDATYIEPAVAPSFMIGSSRHDLRAAFPIALGISDYFFDTRDGGHKKFGFARAGFLISGNPFPDACSWLTVDAGVDRWLPNRAVDSGLQRMETVFHIGINVH